MRRRLFEYPDVITIKELMEILGIGRNKAYELLKSGKIVSFKEGKKYIIPKKSVLIYLNIYNK